MGLDPKAGFLGLFIDNITLDTSAFSHESNSTSFIAGTHFSGAIWKFGPISY